ncbi:TIGR03086 family protein [Modestobacter sp. DSM 44400]|uniref:TIGR03086 family metal-binding protein n=1 Tax=Modestobacter sp. DSM 44400 TaxID=1550230 RepID=UPI00089D381D|nr:TIGR03086 family metal-binding protein [Modestobacter sp. DSM 44400]SDX48213.1 TIGR03086 family protein [Modestobacter sp. DSM 44400]
MPESSRAALLERFQRAQALVTDRVDAVEPEQWDAPALPGWTVADLVAHLTALQLATAGVLAGELADDVVAVPAGTDVLRGDDLLTAWETAADTALTAWALDDQPDRTVHSPRGPVPAVEHLAGLTADLTVHAWDLARATGGDTLLDAELVAAALVVGEQHLGPGGVPGVVGPPVAVPPDADPLTRLLARYGRRG